MSTEISYLSCLIALILSNTHKFALKTQLVMSVNVNSWQRNCMFVLDLCIK